jgi:hypothetical protein
MKNYFKYELFIIFLLFTMIFKSISYAKEKNENFILLEHTGYQDVLMPYLIISTDSVKNPKEFLFNEINLKSNYHLIITDSTNYKQMTNIFLKGNKKGKHKYPDKFNCIDFLSFRVVIYEKTNILEEYYICNDDCFIGYCIWIMNKIDEHCSDKNILFRCKDYFDIYFIYGGYK